MNDAETMWRERAQTAEATISTLRNQINPLREEARSTKDALCAKRRNDGSFDINFDKLVEKLGGEACLQLRAIIDERWKISGEAGAKPRMKVVSR